MPTHPHREFGFAARTPREFRISDFGFRIVRPTPRRAALRMEFRVLGSSLLGRGSGFAAERLRRDK
jgi:hypothetical protein